MKDTFLRYMVDGVDKVVKTFDADSGRFMAPGYEGPGLGWAVTNQDVVCPLSLLLTTAHESNPYHGDPELLEVVEKAGDALRDFQYPDGQVEFVKIDGSKWGPTYMPWSMYHWLEAYALMSDRLGEERGAHWAEGLTLAFDGIMKETSESYHVHNIPTWKGMSLVRAEQVFGREDWGTVGREMIRRAVAAQTEHGYWDEHGGPTTSYNLVYTHAIGLYHAFTGDDSVLPCLRRALDFHLKFTYPDGACVETIDGRVKYHTGVRDRCLASYSNFPDGRRFVRWQVDLMEDSGQTQLCTPGMAAAYQHYHEGEEAPIPHDDPRYELVMGDLARVVRRDGWFFCASAITVEPTDNRWGMDRQSFVSLFRDGRGLIVGGGNSKEQPGWSNFVVGDLSLPTSARLLDDGVELSYGEARCTIQAEIGEEETALTFSLASSAVEGPVRAQLPLHIVPGEPLSTASGATFPTDGTPVSLTQETSGGHIHHNGWELRLPEGAVFEYPISPFNPYAKEGNAPLAEAVAVVRVELDDACRERCFGIGVPAD